jgi:hypothetical protein
MEPITLKGPNTSDLAGPAPQTPDNNVPVLIRETKYECRRSCGKKTHKWHRPPFLGSRWKQSWKVQALPHFRHHSQIPKCDD